jgi:hypothetical protein
MAHLELDAASLCAFHERFLVSRGEPAQRTPITQWIAVMRAAGSPARSARKAGTAHSMSPSCRARKTATLRAPTR